MVHNVPVKFWVFFLIFFLSHFCSYQYYILKSLFVVHVMCLFTLLSLTVTRHVLFNDLVYLDIMNVLFSYL